MSTSIRILPLLFFVFLLGSSPAQAQQETYQQDIRHRLEQFFKATEDKNWSAVLEMTYPRLFELVPKAQMLQLFEQMEGTGMELNMKNLSIRDISAIVEYEGEQFARVEYSSEMDVRFTGEMYDDATLDFIKTSFETTFGQENVLFDRGNRSFHVIAEKALFAIAPTESREWFFIENNPEQAAILEQIIPQAIREKF